MADVYLRFKDLKARGIVGNWTTLQRRIERDGFPPGIWLGANTRVWAESEIEAWLASRPKAGDEGKKTAAPMADT
jgi:hypothetical protein